MSRNNTFETDQLTDSAYYILVALITPRHGYAIMKYIEVLTEGQVIMGPATLYTLLKKMQDAGYIVLEEDEGERRKTYSVTDQGSKIIVREIERRLRMALHGQKALRVIKEVNGNE